MKVDSDDPRPAYAQVADDLRASIEVGRLKPGDRLPPGRDLAAEYGVAVMTIQKALDVLRREGMVVSQQGRGVFVAAARPQHEADDLATLRADIDALARRVQDLEARLSANKQGAPR